MYGRYLKEVIMEHCVMWCTEQGLKRDVLKLGLDRNCEVIP